MRNTILRVMVIAVLGAVLAGCAAGGGGKGFPSQCERGNACY